MSSSTVTYTSVYTDSEPWRFQWVSDDEIKTLDAAPQSPGQVPPSPNYAPGPEHPPSPNYVSGPKEPEQAPLSPDYVPEPEYPEYLASFDEDPEEEPEEDPTDRGDDDDDKSSDDNDDDDDDDKEEQIVSEDDNEEEEHLAPTDSSFVPTIDPVFSAKDTEAFETDESAPTHALIAEYAFAPTPPSPPPSLLSPLSSLLPQIPSPPLPLPLPPTTSPTYAEALLGYRAAGIRLRVASPSTHHPSEIPSPPLLLPSTSHIDDLPEADMPLWKRARFTTPAFRFEVGESSAAIAARQPVLDVAAVDATPGYLCLERLAMGLRVWDDMVGDMEEKAPITIEGLSQRVIDLSTTLSRDTHEIYVRLEDTQDNRAL
ncbi:hypothetical protein Tco_0488461 [Tanacetum coccineum]